MERTDFIENRIDVVKNIYTLYSYAKSTVEEDKEWALQRFKQGKWYVVEPFGNTLLFAPSRFVGYKNNTREKHTSNHGDGTQTNNKFRELKLYKEMIDDYLSEQFELFMISLGIEKDTAKFLVPNNLNIADLKSPHKCYFICPTHCQGQKENAWKNFLSHNFMAIGWNHTDYSNYTIDEIKQDYQNDYTAIGPFTLIKQIKEGDVVCCTNNSYGLWGIGIALSQYKYSERIHYAGIDEDGDDSYYSHYIDIAWLCFKEQGYIPLSEFNIQLPEKQWPPFGTLNQREEIPQYISNFLLYNDKSMEDNSKYDKYINLLKANKNLILTGAPGTGKTYLAKAIAKEMNAEFEFVQFHPSYDYTDFVEGLRPTPPDNNGNIGFKRVDGVFKAFCKRAICKTKIRDLKKESTFDIIYGKIVSDIKEGKINSYKNPKGEPLPLRINSKGRIEYRKNSPRTEKEENIKLMYDYLVSNGIFDLSSYSRDDYWALIKKLSKNTETIDYVEYGWILQELLNRTLKLKVPSYDRQNDEGINDQKYVFIIDEINRGEISKIFGELFFSIDPGYRGIKGRVKTQYQNMITDEADPFYEGFYVPENVYIIGTMNDIDRSVESMDFAMRRRFAWEEIKAYENTSMLDELEEMKEEVLEVMNRLNAAIWNEEAHSGIEGLNAAYHIGGSYFSKLQFYLNKDHTNKKSAYKHLWENHLKGVLFEYLRGTVNAMENLKMLEQVYYNKNNNDDIKG